jgi:hypothetical protein
LPVSMVMVRPSLSVMVLVTTFIVEIVLIVLYSLNCYKDTTIYSHKPLLYIFVIQIIMKKYLKDYSLCHLPEVFISL